MICIGNTKWRSENGLLERVLLAGWVGIKDEREIITEVRSYFQSPCSVFPTKLNCAAILVGEARFLLSVQFLEGRVHFPAIKTHSVPNLLARSTATGEQPIRTEKSNSAGARYSRGPRNKRWHNLKENQGIRLAHSWFCPKCTFFKVVQCPGILLLFQMEKTLHTVAQL